MKYNPKIVSAFFVECGLPEPVFEHRFHSERRWRFDVAWPRLRVAVECQGGIWTGGRHVRGSGLVKEHEKLNFAAMGGWRVLFVQPKDLCTQEVAAMILCALTHYSKD